MPRGIIIFGSAGAGKTTLGKMVAQQLHYPYFDIDDYIWRNDIDIPFTVMYFKKKKASRLMKAISKHEHFVMAGSMDSFHASFDPLFDLAVHITVSPEVRALRLQKKNMRFLETEFWRTEICMKRIGSSLTVRLVMKATVRRV